MKKKTLTIIVVLISLLVSVNQILDDNIIAELLFAFFDDNTVYSEHFNDKKFKQIKIGDTYEKVNELLKETVNSYEVNSSGKKKLYLHYSKAPSYYPGHYRQRILVFESGKVSRKCSKIFFD